MIIKSVLLFILSFSIVHGVWAQTILGIDVSKWQGTINWQQVSNSGKVFAYVKATEGMTYTDPKFLTNITNGKAAGVVMGAYHFARPDNNSAVQDATNFLNVAGSYTGNGYLPPVLDIEDINRNGGTTYLSDLFTPAQLTAWVQTWVTTVQNQTGVTPTIYTNTNYAGYLNSSLNVYGLWIAKPNTSPSAPPNNIGNWNDWQFKQYSWEGFVPGISGNVDLNVFHGSVDDFNELIGLNVENDDCSGAILLNSDSTCMATMGSVDDATSSGWPVAGCDLYAGNALAADVFYKFVATDTIQTISVNPSGDLDAVVSLYEGSDCANLTEIACSDNGGGFGQSEHLTATGLTVGQTYWIRVYDYGSQPPTDGNFEICVTYTSAGSEDISLSDAIITSSGTVNAGETVTAEVTQHYSGNSDVIPDVYLYYYLSEDCVLDASDVLLYDQDFSTINQADPSDEESQVLTIPAATTPGAYYILFVGDATQVIDEFDESNNTACAQITVTNGVSQDIYLSDASITSSTLVTPGENVMAEVTQHYSGDANILPDVYLYYYLSVDCQWDSTDVLLYNQDFSTLSVSDLSDEESQLLTIPTGTLSGTYHILFVGDATNVISESDETNNTACAEITVTDSIAEDIVLSDAIITGATSVNEGETVSVEVTQSYVGPSTTLPKIYLHYYLSQDCTLDDTDVLLDDQHYSTINSTDPSDEESLILNIPHGTNLGKYYILIIGDATDMIHETNEDNNTACLQIFIKSAVPIEEVTLKDQIKVYPNPVLERVYFEMDPTVKIKHIDLLNPLGQVIQTIMEPQKGLDVSQLSAGMYYVKLVSANGDAVYRIVKQ